MKKQIKQAMSFLMAVCLLAGNSYVNVGTSAVMVTDWVEVAEETKEQQVQQEKEPWLLSSFREFFNTRTKRVSAATISNDEFKLMNGNVGANEVEIINHNDTYSFQVFTKADDVLKKIESIETDSKTEKIVKVDRDLLQKGTFRLTAVNAGIERLTITLTSETGEPKMLYMTVVVPLEINKQDEHWFAKNESNTILVLDTENQGIKEKGYQVKLKGSFDSNGSNATNEFVEWVDNYDHNIIEIDTQKGIIIPKGAGTTKVTVKLLKADTTKGVNKKEKEFTFQVIVAPKGLNEEKKEQSKPTLEVTKEDKNQVELVTNISSAYKISWEVDKLIYDDKNAVTEIEIPINKDMQSTDFFEWEVKEGDMIKVALSDLKAGTYRVRANLLNLNNFDEDFRNKFGEKTYIEFTIIVYMNFNTEEEIRMNTGGDVFNILGTSNLSKEDFKNLIGISYHSDDIQTDLENSLIINKEEGQVISGTNGGKSIQVKVTYGMANNNLHIYERSVLEKMESEMPGRLFAWIYNFYIIDAIALSSTELNMYTGATSYLKLLTQNHKEEVIWRFQDSAGNEYETNPYITIELQNDLGTEIALIANNNQTPLEPIKVVAYQEINGVKKSAVCTITILQAIETIELVVKENGKEVPIESAELNQGEPLWIGANVTPDQGKLDESVRTIYWSISDPSVFQISEESDSGVVIVATKAGTAVLTALDARNVVMDSCIITVTEPASGIEIKDIKKGDTVKLKFVKGGTYPLIAEVKPAGNNQKVTWDSKNEKVARINENGLITFVAPGETTIEASVIGEGKDGTPVIYTANFILILENSAAGVSLNYDDVELYVGGDPKQLIATVLPANAANKNVEWISFDTSIVNVDDNGLLTAKSAGKTQVMVRTEEGGHYALCNVTVKQHAMGVKMSYTQITLNVGEYFDMDVTVTPANATEASLLWESLDTNIVTVSSTGRITGRAVGTGKIMVKTQNGSNSFCTVTVVEPVFSLELDEEEVTIDIEDTFVLEPIFQPTNPSNTEVIWLSSDDNVAEVNEFGEVTGISGGSAVITCESVDGGYRAYCLVTVIEPVIEITMNPETYRLALGKTYTLTATVSNHGTATNAELEWSSSDESVCTVDNKGNIVGVDYGYATITAEATDNSGAFATCEVRVIREVTSIKLNHTVLTMLQGESVSLQVNVQPSNASYVTTKFSSSDESVAIVDEDGVITALNPGSAVIRSEARDNSGKFALCYVTVSAPIVATGITVSDKEVVLTPKEQKQVVISMKPTNSTDTVTWTSNNEAVASVNSKGMITAHTTGKATITVMTSSGKMETIAVTVLGLNRTYVEMPIYTNDVKLVVEGATGTVRWDVDDPSICKVTNGVITAKKYGTTKVTVTINGRTLTCTVKVVR